jgi:hypothetical protein
VPLPEKVGGRLSVSDDGNVVAMDGGIWRASEPDHIQALPCRAPTITRDGRRLLINENDTVSVYRVADHGTPELELQRIIPKGADHPQKWVRAISVAGDVGRLVTAQTLNNGYRTEVSDLFSGAKLWDFQREALPGVLLSSDAKTILLADNHGYWIGKFEPAMTLRKLTLNGSQFYPHIQSLSRDGRIAVVQTDSSSARFYDLETDRWLVGVAMPQMYPELNADGSLALANDGEGVLNLVDTRTARPLARLERPGHPIIAGAFALDGAVFTTSRADARGNSEFCVWGHPTPEELARALLPIRLTGALKE